MGVLLSEAFECQFCHPSAPLDSGLRRNDEMGGPNDECEGIPTDAGMTTKRGDSDGRRHDERGFRLSRNDDLVSGWRGARELRVAVTPSWQSGG